jgi:hypothetical protein
LHAVLFPDTHYSRGKGVLAIEVQYYSSPNAVAINVDVSLTKAKQSHNTTMEAQGGEEV